MRTLAEVEGRAPPDWGPVGLERGLGLEHLWAQARDRPGHGRQGEGQTPPVGGDPPTARYREQARGLTLAEAAAAPSGSEVDPADRVLGSGSTEGVQYEMRGGLWQPKRDFRARPQRSHLPTTLGGVSSVNEGNLVARAQEDTMSVVSGSTSATSRRALMADDEPQDNGGDNAQGDGGGNQDPRQAGPGLARGANAIPPYVPRYLQPEGEGAAFYHNLPAPWNVLPDNDYYTLRDM